MSPRTEVSRSMPSMRTMLTALASVALVGCSNGTDLDDQLIPAIEPVEECTQRDITGQFPPLQTADPVPVRYANGSSKVVDLQNETDGQSLSVFFRTSSWTLDSADLADIDAFRQQHQGATSWVLEGFADTRGDEGTNLKWAGDRANGVSGRLTARGVASSDITVVSHGETMSAGRTKEEMQHDRRVTIQPQYFDCLADLTPEARVIVEGLEGLPAEHYLIDLSSSMAEEVALIRGFDYPSGSEVSAFNDCDGVVKLDNPADAVVCGGTPLWGSIIEVLRSENIDSLTVVTDGQNTTGSETSASVIAVAKKEGVKINVVAAGAGYSEQAKSELRAVANGTGGQYYIRD